MAKLVSQVYGEALFRLAVESGALTQLSEELDAVSTALSSNPEYRSLLNHPQLIAEEKKDVFDRVFEGRISSELTGFFHILLDKGRFRDLPAIHSYFHDRMLAHERIGVAFVTSAVALSGDQREKVTQKLLATTHYVSMQMHFDTDPALIGGMKIRIGDRVVDSSIQSKLNDLKDELMKIQL